MPSDTAYREAVDYLYALQHHGIKLGLSNSEMLMGVMDNPHRRFRSIHIAGTNGKGSTSAFIASMLRAAGYRVGLYTSPHLVSFTERIRINGIAITEAKVVQLVCRVRSACAASCGAEPLNPTFFEVATAMAFMYFAEQAVDIAVVEVGMGGRLDSTNVITPLVSVITNIDIEHTEFLGDTLELIAGEKAGIIKQHVPVISGAVQPEVIRVIEKEAAARHAPLYRLPSDFRPEPLSSGHGQSFHFRGMGTEYERLSISMLGRYQADNACLAVAAVECLRKENIAVDERAIRHGLAQAAWEGRLERVGRNPDVYLDGAHNPASARMLAAEVRRMKSAYRKLILVIGILGDKDFRGILSELVPLADRVIATRPDYARGMDVLSLAAAVRAFTEPVETAETVAEAITKAKQAAEAGDLVLITGSLYVVGDARTVLVRQSAHNGALRGLKG